MVLVENKKNTIFFFSCLYYWASCNKSPLILYSKGFSQTILKFKTIKTTVL